MRVIAGSEAQEADGTARESAGQASSHVEQLVEQLGSDRLRDRAAAEQQLLAAGADVLDELPLGVTDPAVREALQRVRLELERRLAEDTVRPTLVSLQGRRTLEEAIDALQQQSENRLDASLLPPEALAAANDYAVEQRTWWEVVDLLLSKHGLALTRSTRGEGSLALMPAGGGHAPLLAAASHNAFRVELVSAEWRAGLPGQRMQLLRLTLRLFAEPRLRPLFADYRDTAIVVVAGEERLTPFNPQASRQPEFNGEDDLELTVDELASGQSRPESIDLSGTIAVEVAAVPRVFRFSPLRGPLPMSMRHGGVTASLARIQEVAAPRKGPEGAQLPAEPWVTIRCRYDSGGPAFESHRIPSLYRQAWLTTPSQRRPTPNGGFELSGAADGAVSVTYRFPNPPADWQEGALLFEAATAIARVPVTFEMKGVWIAAPASPSSGK